MIRPAKPHHWSADDFPDGTTGLRLVRMVSDELRVYEAIQFKEGAEGIAWFLNRWFIHGERVIRKLTLTRMFKADDGDWLHVSDLPAIEEAGEESVREALSPLLDQQREALAAFREGRAGSGTWLNRVEGEIDAALKPDGAEEEER